MPWPRRWASPRTRSPGRRSPFNSAIAPGPKTFDMYLTQVSYSAERTAAVDLSDGYFNLNQAVVALKSNAISKVTTVAGLAAFKLGAPVGTTSYAYITDNIQPTKAPSVYNDLDGALKALQAKQIDGIVVDLPTAFYMRDAQLTGGTIVGYLPTVGDPEYFSVAARQGQQADPVRQPGDRRDQGRRDARPDHPEMDLRRGCAGPEVAGPAPVASTAMTATPAAAVDETAAVPC